MRQSAGTTKMPSTMRFQSSSSPLPALLLSSLNLILIVLASASFAPVFILKTCPTSFGWPLFAVSSTTAVSSLFGFFSQLTHLCSSPTCASSSRPASVAGVGLRLHVAAVVGAAVRRGGDNDKVLKCKNNILAERKRLDFTVASILIGVNESKGGVLGGRETRSGWSRASTPLW
ncbi:hypothetical protein Cni_G06582 [Canna indica]|uniref:Uncharacterized protein n=1 Tax=Canna indica TaxID=4628 RepID=A0AAQ3JYX6_9LILI|nr:hypothetical protein Cni_G06582 [Canna indica]